MSDQFSKLSAEWLSANLSRAYPLDDSTGGSSPIPCRFLVDGLFLTAGIVKTSLYISELAIRESDIVMSITGELITDSTDGGDPTFVTFPELIAIPRNAKYGDVFEFYAEDSQNEDVRISGNVVVGDISVYKNHQTLYKLSIEESKIFPAIVIDMGKVCITSLVVGGVRVTGDVVINLGSGLSATVLEDGTINIESIGRYSRSVATATDTLDQEIDGSNLVIVSDEDLIEEALAKFGTPVTSINGISPDSNGNISIATVDTTFDGEDINEDVVLASGDDGSATVTLKLKRDPYMEAGTINTLIKNCEQLSTRCAIIDTAQTALDNELSNLAARMTRF